MSDARKMRFDDDAIHAPGALWRNGVHDENADCWGYDMHEAPSDVARKHVDKVRHTPDPRRTTPGNAR